MKKRDQFHDHFGELDFGANMATDQIWLLQNGNDLQLDIMGTHDQITIANWFMATYSANNLGFDPTTVIQSPNDAALQSALAAAWHH